jgi:hypothetical protein
VSLYCLSIRAIFRGTIQYSAPHCANSNALYSRPLPSLQDCLKSLTARNLPLPEIAHCHHHHRSHALCLSATRRPRLRVRPLPPPVVPVLPSPPPPAKANEHTGAKQNACDHWLPLASGPSVSIPSRALRLSRSDCQCSPFWESIHALGTLADASCFQKSQPATLFSTSW